MELIFKVCALRHAQVTATVGSWNYANFAEIIEITISDRLWGSVLIGLCCIAFYDVISCWASNLVLPLLSTHALTENLVCLFL